MVLLDCENLAEDVVTLRDIVGEVERDGVDEDWDPGDEDSAEESDYLFLTYSLNKSWQAVMTTLKVTTEIILPPIRTTKNYRHLSPTWLRSLICDTEAVVEYLFCQPHFPGFGVSTIFGCMM